MKIELRNGKANMLRKADLVPGVIYGHGIEATPIQVDLPSITKAMQKFGTTMTFEIQLGKKKHLVYIKDYQQDYLHNFKLTHFDLMKVSATDHIHAHIPLHFINRDIARSSGHVISTHLNDLEVEYQVGKGVGHIEVDLSIMKEKDIVHVSDLVIPEGIHVLVNPHEVVANFVNVVAIEDEEVTEGDQAEAVVYAEEEE